MTSRQGHGAQMLGSRRVWSCLAGLAAVLALAFTACGTTTTTSSNLGNISSTTPTTTVNCSSITSQQASWHLVTSGTLTIASDTTYAPAEYIDTATNQPKGYDIDLAKEFA